MNSIKLYLNLLSFYLVFILLNFKLILKQITIIFNYKYNNINFF